MDAALADWGPDGGRRLVDGQVGLGCRLLHITTEDRYERQPLVDGDCVLIAHVRLDNRADLCRDFGLADRSDLPDSALVMAAYRRHGLDCVQHLLGDWVLALWDRARRRLMIARCATGNVGLFWFRQGRQLLFATGIKALLAHPDCKPAINPERIAALALSVRDPEEDATVYRGIRLLEPGHLLIASADGLERRRWWRPETLEPLRLPSAAQYYEAFQALYGTVVGQHLRVGRGGVAATLSGGLDSGSVIALAAPQLPRPLKAFVHAPIYESAAATHRIGDEVPQARCVAEHVGNVEIVPLHSPNSSIVGGVEHEIRTNAEPTHGVGNGYWIADILENARAAGARVLLMGQGGNATVSYSGTGSLLPMLRSGRLSPVVMELRADQSGFWRAIKWRLIRPLAKPGYDRLRDRGPTPCSFLKPDVAKALKPSRLGTHLFDLSTAFRLGLEGAGRGRAAWMAAGARYGVDIRDPTRDRRIVEFCWRVPDEIHWANGRQRGLVRVGMADFLPAAIRDQTRKGLQSSDIIARLRLQSAEIETSLDRIAASGTARDYLDIEAMRRMFVRIAGGGNSMAEFTEAHRFVRGLGIGLYLASSRR